MISFLLSLFGVCCHSKTTWPMGPKEACTVTCLDCGKVLQYDWRTMRRGPEVRREVESGVPDQLVGKSGVTGM
jgi:hypothetical protein